MDAPAIYSATQPVFTKRTAEGDVPVHEDGKCEWLQTIGGQQAHQMTVVDITSQDTGSKFDCKVHTRAGCNIMPLYIYKSISGTGDQMHL